MNVIILAAGMGSRLRPYTNDRPKCMVPLAGIPMLHRQLDVLRSTGITDITLVGGYRSECLDAGDSKLLLNPKYDVTNMVSTLFCAREQMVDGQDLLIAYGDIVYEPRVLQHVLSTRGDVVVGADREWRRLWETRMDDPLSDAETFKMTDGNKIIELGKKPQSYEDVQAQYMGLIKVSASRVQDFKAVYDGMDRGAIYDGKDFYNMYMTSLIQHLINIGWDVRAALVDNGWLEIDTSEELDTYNAKHESGELVSIVNLQ